MRRLIYVLSIAIKELDYLLKFYPQIEELVDKELKYQLRFQGKRYKITIKEV